MLASTLRNGGRIISPTCLDDAAGHTLAVLIRDNGLDLGLAADLADADNRALDGQRVADENRLGKFALHAVEQAVLAGR